MGSTKYNAGWANLKPWKKGQSGNPHGPAKIPEELRKIRSLSQYEVTKLISKFARMLKAQLEGVSNSEKSTVLELAIASIFQRSIDTGDFQKLSFLLDRAIGKVKDIEETDEELDERQQLAKLSMHELLTIVKNNLPTQGDSRNEALAPGQEVETARNEH